MTTIANSWRMLMKKKHITLLVLFLVAFVGCISDTSDDIYDNIIGNANIQPEMEVQEEVSECMITYLDSGDDEHLIESVLSGKLIILTCRHDEFLPLLSREFVKKHPNVEFTIERMDRIADISQQTALATRLLANPPNIVNTAGIIFEKFSSEALFMDLNPFFDGENGINRENFFCYVFTGAEENDSLFHAPLLISTESVLLNKEYFAAIGVPIDAKVSLTLDEYVEYWWQAFILFPEDEIRVSTLFNMTDLFRLERAYDLQTGIVSVDTERMRSFFERLKIAPRGSVEQGGSQIIYGPTYLEWTQNTGTMWAVDSRYFTPSTNVMYHWGATNLMASHVFMIEEHPEMRFTRPVHLITKDDEIFFQSESSLAILRNSDDHDLAWEFLRFSLNFTDSQLLYENRTNFIQQGFYFPTNKEMFRAHVKRIVNDRYTALVETNTLIETGDEEKDSETRHYSIEKSLQGFTNLVSMVNTEIRFDLAVMNSLIYPDIYLLMSGQQNVEQTLSNIQSRLELYVSE